LIDEAPDLVFVADVGTDKEGLGSEFFELGNQLLA
jgi:hypothetical protein